MAYKNPEDQRAAWRRYYQKDPEKHRAWREEKRRRRRAWFRDFKRTLCCARCGENHPATLDFHHTDPSQKELHIGEMIHSTWSMKKIREEIAKCEVLCSNCHRKEHWIEDNDGS